MSVKTSLSDLPTSPRTQRVLARIPVCVLGETSDNLSFQESTFTLAINPDGAQISLTRGVLKGQRLKLLNGLSGQEEDCVVALVEPREQGHANVRVQFIEPHPEFWHILFPPGDWTPRHSEPKLRKAIH
jgi:hypothetical protein